MATTARSNSGCWTCRTRRKKCDEKGPPCQTCESLRLHCHGYGQRPHWMDGGVQEKAQAHMFKASVRTNTILKRRSRDRASSLHQVEETSRTQTDSAATKGCNSINTEPQECRSASQQETALTSNDETTYSLNRVVTSYAPLPSLVNDMDQFQRGFDDFQSHTLDFEMTESLEEGGDFPLVDLDSFPASPSIMGVRPENSYEARDALNLMEIQLPLTQPGLHAIPNPPISPVSLRNERPLLFRAESAPSQAIGTSQSVERTAQHIEQVFSAPDFHSIHYYTHTLFPSLFQFVSSDDARRLYSHLIAALRESQVFLASITALSNYYQKSQLRRFGLLGSADDCSNGDSAQKHQAAIEGLHRKIYASKFFNDMCSDEDSLVEIQLCCTHILLSQALRGSSDWQRLMEVVASFTPLATERTMAGDNIWVGFNQEVLVYLEFLSCTFTGSEPKFGVAFMNRTPAANRDRSNRGWSNGAGIEYSLMSCLLEITLLRRWKEEHLSKGSLSITELVKRALTIEQSLQRHRNQTQNRDRDNIAGDLDNETSHSRERRQRYRPSDLLTFTNVYSAAATIYLHATVSEARPQIPEIKDGVSSLIEALKLLPRPDLLKRLAWPLCIAACLADSSRYEFFTSLSQRVTEAYGKDENTSRAFAVARECWKLRGGREQDDQTYDWRDGMKSLGTPLLLF